MKSDEERRARELITKAEVALNKWSFFGSSTTKFEDARELYSKAANNYKIAKKWHEAAECFLKCAEMSIKLDSQFDAATNHVLAAEMFARTDPGMAISQYRSAISLLSELGRFGTAAKHSEKVAEMYEQDNSLEQAVNYYQQAADLYAGENSHARAGKGLEKVAMLSATLENYERALKTFEQLGTDSLGNNLLKFNAKKHFVHAGFCALARQDMVAARNCVNRYSELDYTFKESAECKLLEALVEACDESNVDKFADDLYSYDSTRRLDPWETSILIRVKNSIASTIEDEDDELR
mmetsp:Transcript_3767/g.5473  ORF Transcript_3767/g.5473 Transcript_3767/m.5473 type:complete len:295 (-) Transcript_3767:1151-2035(-)|eukprot:CAMPEP_0203795790 /NCGR_PEP_ID=MMETSP0100_2-20121128/7467_1 /ASSEMBLY_ACC=CAM_ASM_000210 /TAXON_ID=96639 /ORGANISM=" , Strain NY0313808BC1" /LENGTH=294 /DNA_ID=CAMNT_0050700421 /DNA_START=406 /DNA_END=1290 /DNA_ORIENTATION=-